MLWCQMDGRLRRVARARLLPLRCSPVVDVRSGTFWGPPEKPLDRNAAVELTARSRPVVLKDGPETQGSELVSLNQHGERMGSKCLAR